MNRHPYFLQFDDGVKQTNLSKSDVENFETFYPERLEQDKIDVFFSELDNLITLQEHKLDKLQNIKKAYLNEMFI
jgi:type I restriction enzyme, S subunit